MSTSFEQKLRRQHPIGPEWQNPDRIDVGDTVTLDNVLGTVCNIKSYKDEDNRRPGTHTFALVSFEGITTGAEWIEVTLLSKQLEPSNRELLDELAAVTFGGKHKAIGQAARSARRNNQLAVRQAIDHAQGTVKLVLMALPYEELHNQFIKKTDGTTQVCDLLEWTLLSFFKHLQQQQKEQQ